MAEEKKTKVIVRAMKRQQWPGIWSAGKFFAGGVDTPVELTDRELSVVKARGDLLVIPVPAPVPEAKPEPKQEAKADEAPAPVSAPVHSKKK